MSQGRNENRVKPDLHGETVLNNAVIAARKCFGNRLIACYALGSLAHGGFSPLVSDVDFAIIIQGPITKEDSSLIESIQQAVKSKGSPLSDRLSIFWGSIQSLESEVGMGRFPPLDKLDLIENGRVIFGEDVRESLSKPELFELIKASAEFSLKKLATLEVIKQIVQPELIYKSAEDVRRLTKIILFLPRLLLTLKTGKIGQNEEAVNYYLDNYRGSKAVLVKAAFAWRDKAPAARAEPVELMKRSLLDLYFQFIDNYHQWLVEHNEITLANEFVNWKDRLEKENQMINSAAILSRAKTVETLFNYNGRSTDNPVYEHKTLLSP